MIKAILEYICRPLVVIVGCFALMNDDLTPIVYCILLLIYINDLIKE